MYWFWDPTMLWVLPGILLAMWAQSRVQGAYSRWSKVRSRGNFTGETAALAMLAAQGVRDVRVDRASAALSDHYDPSSRTLYLSDEVRLGDSLAAIGVAMHEAGHALQHAEGYAPLRLRTAVVPTVNIGSRLAWPVFLAGMLFRWQPLVEAGVILFGLTVVFALISLPVEFNASNRALAAAEATGILAQDEIPGARSVLSAAAMTYVATAVTAVLQLLRLLAISGAGRRRR